MKNAIICMKYLQNKRKGELMVTFIAIVSVASILQAGTGFGFSIMDTPFLLLLFDSHDAIQLNNFMMQYS